ncbi:hypothetical protein HML84_07800 [Alcanivorax sp. IO_7]|nr:hypothetical protein HML84_07800 [Alcanivorax sp. IO_7]
MSLIKAIKVLLFPPENMTFSEVMHEAAKLVFSGGVVVGGVLLEEAVEKMLAGFPSWLPSLQRSPRHGGFIDEVAAALIVYLVDRMDLLMR